MARKRNQKETTLYRQMVFEQQEEYRIKRENIRSRRVQVTMTQAMYDQIKSLADEQHISVNEFINRALERDLKTLERDLSLSGESKNEQE